MWKKGCSKAEFPLIRKQSGNWTMSLQMRPTGKKWQWGYWCTNGVTLRRPLLLRVKFFFLTRMVKGLWREEVLFIRVSEWESAHGWPRRHSHLFKQNLKDNTLLLISPFRLIVTESQPCNERYKERARAREWGKGSKGCQRAVWYEKRCCCWPTRVNRGRVGVAQRKEKKTTPFNWDWEGEQGV